MVELKKKKTFFSMFLGDAAEALNGKFSECADGR